MATTVKFADVDATDVVVLSDEELSLTLPPGTDVGAVDVTVANANGEYTAIDAFTYTDQPLINVEVPYPIALVVGTATQYTTRLTNFGADAPDTTEEIRLSNAAGDLVGADVVYETQDVNQTWKAVEWVEDGGDLVVTYTYTHTAAGRDITSDVRVTATRDTGDITGASAWFDADGAQISQTTYTYTVLGGA